MEARCLFFRNCNPAGPRLTIPTGLGDFCFAGPVSAPEDRPSSAAKEAGFCVGLRPPAACRDSAYRASSVHRLSGVPPRPLCWILGDSTLRAFGRAIQSQAETLSSPEMVIFPCLVGGATVSELARVAQQMPEVDTLVLCICGNDLLAQTDGASLRLDISRLSQVARGKADKVALLLGGSRLMGSAPEGFDTGMAAMAEAFAEEGLAPQGMASFEHLPRRDRLHFADSAVLEVCALVMQRIADAPRVQKLAGIFYEGALWPESCRGILLRRDQGALGTGTSSYHPVCIACNKRATREHLLSGKCTRKRSQGEDILQLAAGCDQHWGVHVPTGAAMLTLQEFAELASGSTCSSEAEEIEV